MLQIQHVDCIEKVKISDLFTALNLSTEQECETANSWPIEVLSFDTFYPIEGFRTTAPLDTLLVKTDDGRELEAAEEHLMMSGTRKDWAYLKDLQPGDTLISHNTSPVIVSIEKCRNQQTLFDMQVSIAHSYMTNGLLSHNSHFLVQMGAEALRAGKNVVHYTFELSETAVGLRYDSNLCSIPSSDVIDRKEEVIEFYKNNSLGRLIIKEYPTGTPSVQTLRNHIEKLLLKSFVPSVIIIDYADIMKSSRKFDSLRHELKLVYEELRNLSMDLNVPIWTASQANREASNSEVVGLENMSEAYGKAMVADVVLSISRKPNEKATGAGRIFVAKNRAGRDGMLYPMRIDTSMSKFELIDTNEMTVDDVVKADGSSMKKLLKEKWEEINGK
jgi:hypothetical protein